MTSYQKNVKLQNAFNDEIKALQDKGFKPLTPIFDENDTKKLEKYILEKKQKINSNSNSSKIFKEDGSEDFEIEDNLIQDPSLAALLNEDREIIVGDSLYKYTESGLYFCLEKDRKKLYNYLANKSFSSKNKLTKRTEGSGVGISFYAPNKIPFMYVPIPILPVPNYFPTPPTPKLIKSNLEVSFITSNGFFEGLFGPTQVSTENFDDGHRVKVKFWNQDYKIFSSIGCKVRFQKRVKILGISGWQKSYCKQIELGVNDISYDYNFNVPINYAPKFNYETFFIEINGIKYAGSGKQIIEFPIGKSNFPYAEASPQSITVTILDKELLVKYDANKIYNQAVDEIIKEAFKKIVSYNPSLKETGDKIENGEVPYKVLTVNQLANKVTISTQGTRWTRNNDNAITHYFDFNFLLTYKSSYDSKEDYLKGLEGSTKYTNVRADIYGAALHNNIWKGRRLVLENSKK